MLHRQLVALLGEGGFLYLQLHYAAALFVKLGGHAVHLGTHQRAGLIHKVYGLIRQEPVADIAMGKGCCGDKCVVVYLYAMEYLIPLLEAAQYAYGILDGGLIHHDGLESPGKGGVLFDILAVFVKGGGAYAMELTPCKHGLKQVARIHAALGTACANDIVQLVDKEDYSAFAALHLVEHRLEPLLKLAPELCAGNQRTHVQGEYPALFKVCGHVSADYALGQALRNSSLAHARLAYEHRVVLTLAGEYADNVSHFLITAYYGVQLLLSGKLHQILGILAKGIVCALGAVGGYPCPAANLVKGL